MHASPESERLHRIDYAPPPLLGVDIAVDVVAAADCGGRVVAVSVTRCLCVSRDRVDRCGVGSSKRVLVSD